MREMQQRIIESLGVRPKVDAGAEIDRRVGFLVDYLRSTQGAKGFVLGISGGQDSSLAGRLCQLAVERVRDQGEQAEFFAVRLPYGEQRDEDDALLALRFIAPDHVLTADIQGGVDALAGSVSTATGVSVSDYHKGNIKARMRMLAQYAIAGERQLLVVGTDHAAEAVTGFFTKFGDGAADVVPLAGLSKQQGAELLSALGAPERLWEKIPTADLLDGVPGRSDESELGMRYADIDTYLAGEDIPEEIAVRLEQRYRASEHKRRLPVTIFDSWWKENRR